MYVVVYGTVLIMHEFISIFDILSSTYLYSVGAVGCLWITLLSGPIIGSIPHPSLAIQTIESGAEWTTPDSSCNLKPHQMQQRFLTMRPKSIGNQQLDLIEVRCVSSQQLLPQTTLSTLSRPVSMRMRPGVVRTMPSGLSQVSHPDQRSLWEIRSPNKVWNKNLIEESSGLYVYMHSYAFSIPCTCVDVRAHNASLMHVISATMCAYRYLVICVKHLCVCISVQ